MRRQQHLQLSNGNDGNHAVTLEWEVGHQTDLTCSGGLASTQVVDDARLTLAFVQFHLENKPRRAPHRRTFFSTSAPP